MKGALIEDKFATIWPDYPCLCDVRSIDFRNRDLHQQAIEAGVMQDFAGYCLELRATVIYVL